VLSASAARRELVRRRAQALFTTALLYEYQRRYVEALTRTVVVCWGRRTGKSHTAVFKALRTCLDRPGVAVVYISATRASVKKFGFKPACKFNRDHKLDGSVNLSDLSISFRNSSILYCIGVDSEQAADKTRGIPKLQLAIVDESQRYKPDLLQYLIRDCLRPGLLDVGESGQLWIMGTPSTTGPVGEFYERWTNPANYGSNTIHTYQENPSLGPIQTVEALIEQDLKDEKRTRTSAWFRREYLCEWVEPDQSERVYDFENDRNTYQSVPVLGNYLICGDTGVRDADALAVLGWSSDSPTVYLVREFIKRGQDVDDLGKVLLDWYNEFKPIQIVLDAGANLKSVLTLQNRYRDLPITAAIKPAVNQQIAETNDYLRRGWFKASPHSRYAREVRLPVWVDGIVGGKVDESGPRKSDIVPAVRYGLIAARPFLPDKVQPVIVQPARDNQVLASEAQIDELMRQQQSQQANRVYGAESATDFIRPDY
jgi:hypothetical protein